MQNINDPEKIVKPYGEVRLPEEALWGDTNAPGKVECLGIEMRDHQLWMVLKHR